MSRTAVWSEQSKRLKANAGWKRRLIHLFPVPALAVYTLFIVYPIVAAFSYSLFDWKGLQKGRSSGSAIS
ncbi:hypothetical protein LJK87_20125 [Paenibacillus sp. P25]|nr:hypothetical protein LJK87_20125 [Paenibacillus sp. P25]